MAGNLPGASYFTLQFSATDRPGGLGIIAPRVMQKVLDMDATVSEIFGRLVYVCSLLLLVAQAPMTAFWLGRRYAVCLETAAWTGD